MKRMLATVIVVVVAGVVGPATAMPPPEVGVALEPTFTAEPRMAISSMLWPCEIATPTYSHATVEPDAAAARIDLSAGTAVRTCPGSTGTVTFDRWHLGAVPDALVGLPGHVTLELTVDEVDRISRGRGARAARIAFTVFGPTESAPTVNIFSVSCRRLGCEQDAPHEGRMRIRFAFEAFPETMSMDMVTNSSARTRRPAEVGLLFGAHLDRVLLVPAVRPAVPQP